jgi:hypothetical protein
MSAQIIAALRRRADALLARSRQELAEGGKEPKLRAMMDAHTGLEFRMLADEAEGREPGGGHG